ncbi:MAG TPA: hypothetical protein V6D06_17035 [Trichocoleus sp.]
MNMSSQPQLRTNPFLTYRDPETGHWVTVVPRSQEALEPTGNRPPQVLRVVEPEDFFQMNLESA